MTSFICCLKVTVRLPSDIDEYQLLNIRKGGKIGCFIQKQQLSDRDNSCKTNSKAISCTRNAILKTDRYLKHVQYQKV
jgi:hypothetical protein